MSQPPTDRGYVKITDSPAGGKRVEIYARMSRSGLPTHLFAVHDSADVVVDSKAVFERAGADSLSAEPMEVSVDTDGKLYVREPLRMESLPQFGMQRR